MDQRSIGQVAEPSTGKFGKYRTDQNLNNQAADDNFTELYDFIAALSSSICVKDMYFALVDDGVTDNYTAVNDAILYAIAHSPCKVVFPANGTYKVNAPLGPYFGDDVTIDLQGSVLDFSSVVTAVYVDLLSFSGSYAETPVSLTSNAAENSQTIQCVSGTFAPKDFVRIYSNKIWDSTRTNTRIGELNFIDTVPNSSSVSVVVPIESDYTTADSAKIQKLIPIKNVHITGGTLLAPVADDVIGGIRIILGIGCSIKNVRTFDCDIFHIRLQDCFQCDVDHCEIEEANNATQAYGITCADACQDCTISVNKIRNVRHAFTTNNNVTTSYGITRRIKVVENNVYNNVDNLGGGSGDALDTHAGSEDIEFIHNTIKGAFAKGINCESRSAKFHGNIIDGATSHGISVISYTDGKPGEFSIEDNTISGIGDTVSTDFGIYVGTSVYGIKKLTIADNTIKSKSRCIYILGKSYCIVDNIAIGINNCEIRSEFADVASTECISITYGTNISINGNPLTGKNIGIYLESCSRGTVCANPVNLYSDLGTSLYGIYLSGSSKFSVTGNSLEYTGSVVASTFGIRAANASLYCGIFGNILDSFNDDVYISADSVGTVEANNISAA